MADLVFVCGTVSNDEQVATLLDSYRLIGDAIRTRRWRVDGQYPTLVPDESVTGRLLEPDEIDPLDRYEGLKAGVTTGYRCRVPGGCGDYRNADS